MLQALDQAAERRHRLRRLLDQYVDAGNLPDLRCGPGDNPHAPRDYHAINIEALALLQDLLCDDGEWHGPTFEVRN